MKWTKIEDGKPPKDKYIILACPTFCESGYVIAIYDGKNYEVNGYGQLGEEQEIQAWSKLKPYYKSIF